MARVEAERKDPRVTSGSIIIRKCESLGDMRSCVALQKEVWNFTDIELVPLRMFVVAPKIGGQVIAAFEGNEMIGFALANAGRAPAISRCWLGPAYEVFSAGRCFATGF